MVKQVLPPWLMAVLALIWSVAAGLVESGLLPEGSPAYTIALVLSAALGGVVGVKGIITAKMKREAVDGGKLTVNHRTSDIRTKPPEPRR